MNPDDIDYAMVSNKLSEAAMTRGKKGVDRVEQVNGCSISWWIA